MANERINLVVLFGGQSAEHDVSCTTATHVLAAADPDKYRVTPIGISTEGEWALATEAQAALAAGAGELPSRLDPSGDRLSPSVMLGDAADSPERTVVLPLLHGPLGEDGTVQGLMELANVAYVGSGVLGSAVAMDKAMAKQVLAAAGVQQARYRAFPEHEITPGLPAELADELGLPCFVKPANMGSSVGVTKAKTVEELRDAIHYALTYDQWVVVEEGVVGREIEVAVIGNEEPFVSLPGEIVPGDEFYSYDDKYVNDASTGLIPAPISPEQTAEVRAMALEVFTALRCDGLARCDFFLEEEGPARGFLCNEVNTMPGFTPISMFPKMLIASGMTYGEIIDRLVELAIDRHQRRRRNTKH
ncbi:MAG: D-alanine--D-alanine ligase family protein [Ilumatobacter sp.]|uniref:D-alanine--D-alanine ligase family protein n=1 Tax=Ilumatobacter sp. TaxID=1967498 RepID=UPI00261E232C|nr:D-alanine--D-alanine ligase family protein [Ilumatobacter sp.]MDJ0770283.1 D-alanine--D-alanine ligase family protein [Ilumatobacter sp.]